MTSFQISYLWFLNTCRSPKIGSKKYYWNFVNIVFFSSKATPWKIFLEFFSTCIMFCCVYNNKDAEMKVYHTTLDRGGACQTKARSAQLADSEILLA